MRKKAFSLLTDQPASLIIAVACIAFLLYFTFMLLSAGYDENAKTAEGYMNSFKEKISDADKGYVVDFSLWGPEDPKGAQFYLSYFGDKSSFKEDGRSFVKFGMNENLFCLCYYLDKTFCKECVELEHPAVFEGREAPWVILQGQRVKISKVGDSYVMQSA